MIWKPLSLQSQTDLSVLLGQNVMDHLTMYICQSESTALITVSQLLMINAKQSQNRRVKIMNMDTFVGDVVPKLIGFPVSDARVYSTTCHPQAETARVMITTKVVAV